MCVCVGGWGVCVHTCMACMRMYEYECARAEEQAVESVCNHVYVRKIFSSTVFCIFMHPPLNLSWLRIYIAFLLPLLYSLFATFHILLLTPFKDFILFRNYIHFDPFVCPSCSNSLFVSHFDITIFHHLHLFPFSVFLLHSATSSSFLSFFPLFSSFVPSSYSLHISFFIFIVISIFSP